jgi:hypothetical protein
VTAQPARFAKATAEPASGTQARGALGLHWLFVTPIMAKNVSIDLRTKPQSEAQRLS